MKFTIPWPEAAAAAAATTTINKNDNNQYQYPLTSPCHEIVAILGIQGPFEQHLSDTKGDKYVPGDQGCPQSVTLGFYTCERKLIELFSFFSSSFSRGVNGYQDTGQG